MRSRMFSVLLLLLTAVTLQGSGCIGTRSGHNPIFDSGMADGSMDATTDAATDVCGGCSGATPVCDTVSMTCVGCLVSTDCSGATPVCNTAGNTCVECLPASEAADCGMKSCDPATNTCTATDRASLDTCEACVSDSECSDVNERCVATNFMGVANGAYCLRLSSATCAEPYSTLVSAVSLSGEPMMSYCAFIQSSTSCDAIRALLENRQCPGATDAECNADGSLCRMVGAFSNRCTYSCASSADCPQGGSAQSCGGGYCGS